MNKQQKKNQRIILIIFGMSVIPFLFAWYLKENPHLLAARTNNGDLILPPMVTERSDLTGFDDFSKQNLKELEGHWVLVNVVSKDDCNADCRQAVFKTRQLLLMMGKDLMRIRRVVLLFKAIPEDKTKAWWQDDTRLLRARPTKAFQDKLNDLKAAPIDDGMLLLMDPFGNIMMYYKPGFDPYDVKSDLKKLLNISQIG
ncbi:MAG: hypothetical protein CVV13_03065 [Gammaproteobacteria bacterium HGW-Gammaproteobacteria-3]|jgi:hypothetical protein|nr:MAG: hypothetical protein CVV13_03065 [Gammaproteobacteria bacterium HGW-Gammaproteobacteria-3]